MSDGKQLDLWHVLLVAEAISGKRAERLAEELYLAGVELPLDAPFDASVQVGLPSDTVEETVRLSMRVIDYLPIPHEDRERVGYVCMCLLLGESTISGPQRKKLKKEIMRTVKAREAGLIDVTKLTDWAHSWVAQGEQRPGSDAMA